MLIWKYSFTDLRFLKEKNLAENVATNDENYLNSQSA